MRRDAEIARLGTCLAVSVSLHAAILAVMPQFFLQAASHSSSFGTNPDGMQLTVRLAPAGREAGDRQPSNRDRVHDEILLLAQESKAAVKISNRRAPHPAQPVYHAAGQLSHMPEMLDRPDAIEISQAASGTVVFRMLIDSSGKAKLIQPLKSTLPREVEGEIAWQLYKAKYRPGEIRGVPVNSEITVSLVVDSSGWLTDRLPVLRPASRPAGRP